jgi:hypothetical protein
MLARIVAAVPAVTGKGTVCPARRGGLTGPHARLGYTGESREEKVSKDSYFSLPTNSERDDF